MRWLACAVLFALPARASAGEPRGVLVLSSGGDRAREAVLVDALRIYMRDLGRPVRLGGAAPGDLEPQALGRVADEARRAEAEVVVWLGERGGAPVLYALRVATSDLRATPVALDDPLLAARTLALKVRALVSARVDESAWSVPPEAPPAATGAAPPDAGEPADGGDEEPSPSPPAPPALPPAAAPAPLATPSVMSVRAAAVPPTAPWVEGTVAYGATVPTETAWVRHGLTVRLAVPWGRWPAAVFVDAAFTTEPSTTVDGNAVAARVWPVGVGIALRLRRARWQISLAPRASLQIVDASALGSDGQTGSARRYAAGLGLLGEAAWLFSRSVAAVASVGVEALVPRLEFAAGGAGRTDLGWVQFSFTAGLLFSVPHGSPSTKPVAAAH